MLSALSVEHAGVGKPPHKQAMVYIYLESADLDQEFVINFSCMETTDRDVLVNDLHSLLRSQLSREGCAFFLDMTNWWVDN